MGAREIAGKGFNLTIMGGKLAWIWLLTFMKIRFYRCKLCKKQRNLDQRMSRLGTEIYSLYRQGETEFLKSLVVRQQLKIGEEAESNVLAIHDRIDSIGEEYKRKKEAICGCQKEENDLN